MVRAPNPNFDVDTFRQLQELHGFAANGSDVARRMLQARITWVEGQTALDGSRDADAVRLLAAALRLSVADGDPFSGWWQISETSGLSRYYKAAANVLRNDPDSVDVRLVRAVALLQEGRYEEAETEVTNALAIEPSDAYGCLAYRGIIRGNRSKWDLCLEDWAKAVHIVPDEPIFYYWRAVCISKQASDSTSLGKAIADCNRFLSRASLEGRKFSEARYAVACLSMGTLKDCKDMSRLRELCTAAIQAEAAMLPVFRELDSDSKQTVLRISKVLNLVEDNKGPSAKLQTSFRSLTRQQVNEIYSRGDYAEAIAGYTKLLEFEPDHLVLANRSAANSKLGFYTDAVSDAEQVVRLKPDWVKGYMRLAQAEIGRCAFDAAVAAADAGLDLNPSNSDLQNLRSMALAGLERGSSRGVKCKPEALDCWKRVMFKGAVRVVDPAGSGDFVNLLDALQCSRLQPPDNAGGWTIILRPGVYELHAVIAHTVPVQLLGETVAGPEPSKLDPQAKLQSGADTVKPHNKTTDHPLIAVGNASRVFIEGLALFLGPKSGNDINCLGIADGASLTVIGCVLYSKNSPCVGLYGSGTQCTLRDCLFKRKASAGVVVDAGATLHLEKCEFRECSKAAVEIRGPESSGRLVGCKFRDCRRQAVVLYGGSKRLEMDGCEVFRCGQAPAYSAVLVGGDATVLRKRVFTENPAEAIVMQGADESIPFISMDECRLTENGAGITFGKNSCWGILSRNRIEENAGGGVVVSAVATGRKVTFRDNTIVRNGPGRKKQFDVVVISDLADQVELAAKGNIPSKATLIPGGLISGLQGRRK